MRKFSLVVLFALPLFLFGCGGGGSESGGGTILNLTGTWKIRPVPNEPSFIGDSSSSGTIKFTQTNGTVTGTFVSDPPAPGTIDCIPNGTITGSVSGDTLVFKFSGLGGTASGTFRGTSNSLKGTGTTVFDGTICSGSITGTAMMTRI